MPVVRHFELLYSESNLKRTVVISSFIEDVYLLELDYYWHDSLALASTTYASCEWSPALFPLLLLPP